MKNKIYSRLIQLDSHFNMKTLSKQHSALLPHFLRESIKELDSVQVPKKKYKVFSNKRRTLTNSPCGQKDIVIETKLIMFEKGETKYSEKVYYLC